MSAVREDLSRHGFVCGGWDCARRPSMPNREAHSRGWTVLICASLLAVTLSAIAAVDPGGTVDGPVKSRSEAYVSLPPLRINSNAELQAAALLYGWPGLGTQADPYIIQGYEVNASGTDTCIYVGNTTAHFTMSSCWLHGGASSGLLLAHVTNATFDANTLSGGAAGASASFSPSLVFTNNTFTGSLSSGLYCFICDLLYVSNNTFRASAMGLQVSMCDFVEVRNNTFTDCDEAAMDSYGSTALTLRNNTMSGCGITVRGTTVSAWASHDMDDSNVVNGKPVFYASGQDGGTATPGSGQVILGGCSNMSVDGLVFDNAGDAVQVGFGYAITIANCSFSNGGTAVVFTLSNHFTVSNISAVDCAAGIEIGYSHNFTVDNNTCLRTGQGLYLLDSETFRVDNNSMSDCVQAGISLTSSTLGTLRNNTQVNNGFLLEGYAVSHWESHDIDPSNTVNGKPVLYAVGAHFAVITASPYGQVIIVNTFMARIASADITNATAPIILGFCMGCSISISNCSGSYAGILLSDSTGTVIDSTAMWNNEIGVIAVRSDQTRLTNDVIGDCPTAGVYSLQSRELDIRLNDFYRCGIWLEGFVLDDFGSHSITTDAWVNGEPIRYLKNQVGGVVPENSGQVILVNCSDILVANQTVSGSTIGVHINFSSNITVRNCTSNGNLDGLEMLRCYGSVVENSSFSDNVYGIVASTSAGNLFRDNLVWGSSSWGFYLSSGTSDNRIYNNTFGHNMGTGDGYNPSFIQAYDGGTNNFWNATGAGNHWADWTTPDSNGDGIVDLPYVISGPANAMDHFPLTDPLQVVPELGGLALVVTATTIIILLTRVARTRRGSG